MDAPRAWLNGQTPNSGHLDKAWQKEKVYEVLREQGYPHIQARRSAHRIVEKCHRAIKR